ncbi:hypothetical protein FCM35_KLT14991 [Carex littledalei]|uniref:Uncharacterized protein n=1 Tax=Carex littledalei TaxID=544730 RepID=A0A833QH07_9POAL|nr:hypothetical protein FCM35_KLT14991 [Carex littledalei]
MVLFNTPIKPLIIPSEVPAEDNHKTNYAVESQPLDGFVAVDIGALLACTDEPVSNKNLARTMSRKGSQKTPDGDPNCTGDGGPGAGDKLDTYVHVAGANGETLNGHTGMTTANPGGKYRRLNSRRSSQWINPRRVLFTFATVSSMGTLILLYFTLSMGKMAMENTNMR